MWTRRMFLAATGALIPATAQHPQANDALQLVTAPNGGGDFRTIQQAIDHAVELQKTRPVAPVILEIRPGIYKERLKVPQDQVTFNLIGKDAASTVITADVSAAAAGGTFRSATVDIAAGSGFVAENLTIANTFGVGSQAVALSVRSDRSVFRKCRLLGWQDTLFAGSGRHYYDSCYIEGHVDFIFGNAAAVFDRCEIHSCGAGYITAVGRTSDAQPTGYIFRDCRLTGDAALLPPGDPQPIGVEIPFPPRNSGKGVFLGRPWRSYARAAFINCWMGPHIRPEGWDNWNKPDAEITSWFGEMGSTGPGAQKAARVPWAKKMTVADADAFAPAVFLAGADHWNPAASLR